ncbi:MAG: PilZ domain-containing protein [Acidobacteria bacterium]|nr:PilZ domain-containing protein [Acidobacteriota bacterium]MBS1866722.1 PilZ domain-containing protein [Acidobacteriota bacterium]
MPRFVDPSALPQSLPSPIPGSGPAAIPSPVRPPALKVAPLRTPGAISIRRFARIPTHAVGVFHEQREYPRASLRLPLRLRSVSSIAEDFPITLVTRDISSTGVFFLCPKRLEMNANIELEIVLVSRPMGRGNVVAVTLAKVRRVEAANMPGWFGIAASFDDLNFDRDDGVPSRFPCA